tara:strand:- start:1303 stop:2736 length:1434 start_codon:yes stop_codon:yes gene_type:complete
MISNFFIVFYFPELLLGIGILILILLSLFIKKNTFNNISLTSILLLFFVCISVYYEKNISFAFYEYLFKSSNFITFFKILIIIGSIVSISISINFFNELKLKKFEIPILILFSTLGMLVLISSNNLMSMYLGIELQSLSLYIIAAINRDSLKSSEAGVKYFILGALSSGILLYGCSLVYGFSGTSNFDEIKFVLSNNENLNIGMLFGLIFILTGMAFKISAVPFHMWTPDVYEGAPTAITAFFAIVPKIAGIALIYRFCLEPFGNFVDEWRQIIIFLSIASMFVGAIAAIVQNNIKRLLAYSSIGHVGYLLIGLASSNQEGVKGLLIYVTIYLLMNIAIFTIILSLKTTESFVEKLSDLSGMSKKKPILSLCIAIVMLSLAGIPPFAGFFGKFYIFISALKADLIYLAILGVIASVISAYYYLRIIKIIYFDESIYDYQANFSKQSNIILFISIILISFFVLYPSLIVDITNHIIIF